MKMARILLAFTMLLAIVFKSLPDSVFDHFHQHEHAVADSKKGDFVGSYKHNCHIEDWNFESFDPIQNTLFFFTHVNKQFFAAHSIQLISATCIHGTGRAPPISVVA